MGVVYSLYDALVSINVPNDKAKAVIDAMEREMMDKVATKSDLENLRLANKADLEHVRDILSKDIRAVEVTTKTDLGHMSALLSRDMQSLATKTERRPAPAAPAMSVRNPSPMASTRARSIVVPRRRASSAASGSAMPLKAEAGANTAARTCCTCCASSQVLSQPAR